MMYSDSPEISEESLRDLELLWDDLYRNDAVKTPDWHKEVLDERQRMIEEGTAHFLDFEQAKHTINELIQLDQRD